MITLTNVKDYLNISGTDAARDVILTTYIAYATSLIEKWCQTPIKAVAKDFYFNGLDSEYKYLPFIQVNTLTSTSYRDDPSEAWTTLTCYVTIINGVYKLYNPDFFTKNEYKAVLNVGFSTIPDDIKLICTEIVATIWTQSNKGDDGLGRLGIQTHNTTGLNGLVQNTTFKDLTMEWKNNLRKYTVPTV
jgi:hypothetical protein